MSPATSERLRTLASKRVITYPAEKQPLPPLPVEVPVPAGSRGHLDDSVYVAMHEDLVHERRDCAEATGEAVQVRLRRVVRWQPSCAACRDRRWA